MCYKLEGFIKSSLLQATNILSEANYFIQLVRN